MKEPEAHRSSQRWPKAARGGQTHLSILNLGLPPRWTENAPRGEGGLFVAEPEKKAPEGEIPAWHFSRWAGGGRGDPGCAGSRRMDWRRGRAPTTRPCAAPERTRAMKQPSEEVARALRPEAFAWRRQQRGSHTRRRGGEVWDGNGGGAQGWGGQNGQPTHNHAAHSQGRSWCWWTFCRTA